jgi:hypothetical protein
VKDEAQVSQFAALRAQPVRVPTSPVKVFGQSKLKQKR